MNERIASYNSAVPDGNQLSLLDTAGEAWPQLNKIAFRMATGSGKTLVMHANILQYRYYLQRPDNHEVHRRRQLNRITTWA